MVLRYGFSFLILFCVISVGAQSTRVAGPVRWHNSPVSSERTNARLIESAERVEAGRTVQLMTLYDIGYPHSVEEFEKLDGNSILMVTMLSHQQNTFPFTRVYSMVGSQVYDLKPIKEVVSQNEISSKVTKVFGKYRSDALYLLPFYVRLETGSSVWAQPASGDKAIRIATFTSPVSETLNFLPNKKPTGKGPIPEFLDLFARREYPAFFEKKQ